MRLSDHLRRWLIGHSVGAVEQLSKSDQQQQRSRINFRIVAWSVSFVECAMVVDAGFEPLGHCFQPATEPVVADECGASEVEVRVAHAEAGRSFA